MYGRFVVVSLLMVAGCTQVQRSGSMALDNANSVVDSAGKVLWTDRVNPDEIEQETNNQPVPSKQEVNPPLDRY